MASWGIPPTATDSFLGTWHLFPTTTDPQPIPSAIDGTERCGVAFFSQWHRGLPFLSSIRTSPGCRRSGSPLILPSRLLHQFHEQISIFHLSLVVPFFSNGCCLFFYVSDNTLTCFFYVPVWVISSEEIISYLTSLCFSTLYLDEFMTKSNLVCTPANDTVCC